MKPKSKERKSKNKTNTQMETFNLYKQGKTIQEIIDIRSLKKITIEKHILSIWENDKNENIDKIYVGLTEEYENEIKIAIQKVGTVKLRDIKDIVNKKISYFQIQTCILLMK
jgi:ATP-dependent DNA helicase RecQ